MFHAYLLFAKWKVNIQWLELVKKSMHIYHIWAFCLLQAKLKLFQFARKGFNSTVKKFFDYKELIEKCIILMKMSELLYMYQQILFFVLNVDKCVYI